jgi:decaprenylphospho-beta-D-erythro-pentofuranosid-2-ulose 2-reductase
LEFKNKTVLILGGNSDVGKSLAKDFAKLGSNLILTSRKEGQLDSFKSDLEIRYSIQCDLEFFDVLDFNSHKTFYNNLKKKPDIAITCVGYLDNQQNSQNDFEESLMSIQTNFTGLVSILNIISNDFEKREKGLIVGISSVAGDRGRGTNYIYGSSKSALTCYLSGLRNKMSTLGIKVITVKPGFIDTKMTSHLDLPKPLTLKPHLVSKDIIKGIKENKNVIYTGWYWRYIMLIIILIPEGLFKKMKF